MTSRSCAGCGSEIQRTKPTGIIPPYCSEDCKPRCSVDGCVGARRKRGWCASHYAQWKRTGLAQPFVYKWSPPADACIVCHKDRGGSPFRVFCSAACRFLWRTYGGDVPTVRTCVSCHTEIDLTARGKGGQRRKSSVKLCTRCKNDYGKYKLAVAQIAERDGTDCGLCGTPVDMTLRRSESVMCASVDHITPRSHGGTHEPENLQLAHLHCNQVKSDRVPIGGVR